MGQSEPLVNPTRYGHVHVQVGWSLHHNRQMEFGEPPVVAGVRDRTPLGLLQGFGGELLLIDPGKMERLGVLKFIEQNGCATIKLAVLFAEQRPKRTVQYLEERDVVVQAVANA
jgi:hypothetical protein